MRKLVVDMVLYTDLRLHFDFVGNFRKQAAADKRVRECEKDALNTRRRTCVYT